MRDRLQHWARELTRDICAVYLARRDPRVPWYAKALAICVAAYAFSPIDLIPDFIPILGYVDDLVILPLGVLAVVRMIPRDVMAEHRVRAASLLEKPTSRAGAVVIVALWIGAAALCGWLMMRWLGLLA
jgi:uncharacterized membrane protein YkvA (DUF1232 family)